jgi:hypothetical protein
MALLRCFVVTGEIVAPVTRCRLVRYVNTFSEHRRGRWMLAAIAFADSSFPPIPPGSLRKHFPADPKGGIAPPELLDKISPMPVDIKGSGHMHFGAYASTDWTTCGSAAPAAPPVGAGPLGRSLAGGLRRG